MNVGERIVELRISKGLTTNKLANLSGVSQSHLREIELGKRNPTVETLSFFCDALGISLSDFFNENNNDNINPMLLSAIKKLSEEQQMHLAELIISLL